MSVCLERNSSPVALPTTTTAPSIAKVQPESQNADAAIASVVVTTQSASKTPTIASSEVQQPPKVAPAANSMIAVLSAPMTLMKGFNSVAPSSTITLVNESPVAPINDKQQSAMNVFVKKCAPAEGGGISIPDMPQSHKLLTATSFPPTNLMQKLPLSANKQSNGQRPTNRVKIFSHMVPQGVMQSGAGPSNVLLNRNPRFFPQTALPPKIIGNGAAKFVSKTPVEGVPKRIGFPLVKNMKTMSSPPFKGSAAMELKNLPPGTQRQPPGLKTISPQRPLQVPNRTNYIGKHAVQAQKVKPKLRAKMTQNPAHMMSMSRQAPDQSAHNFFNDALTAQIMETLYDNESTSLPAKFDPCDAEYNHRAPNNLETLSFVSQIVMLDHNYNATLPLEPPPMPAAAIPTTPPANGAAYPMYSPISSYVSNTSPVKRNRTASQCMTVSTPPQSQPREAIASEEDAASDISEPKLDTEGEETDTSPEAEAVGEANDRYGDYVTRCICGFIHDDGFMIECDNCKVWQHVRCVVRAKRVPNDYSCEQCEPRAMDKIRARSLQQQFMREARDRDEEELRKEQQQQQQEASESDSSDAEAASKSQAVRRKEASRRQRRDSANNRTKTAGKRKERKVPMKRTPKPKAAGKSVKDEDENLEQLRRWIEKYEEAVTNHYSRELHARIRSSVRLNSAQSDIIGGVDLSVNMCVVQPTSSVMKCLIASVSLPMGTPVIELRGKYMLSTQHRLTTRQQRPAPFLFFHTIMKDTEVCVDTSTYGNDARFVRRSCTPNAKLQQVLEKGGTMHLYIVTTKSVEKGSELTIRHESDYMNTSFWMAHIPCACVNSEYCAQMKGHRRHNGDAVVPIAAVPEVVRKRRRRQSNKDASPNISERDTSAAIAEEGLETEIKEMKKEAITDDADDVVKEEIEAATNSSTIKEDAEMKDESADTVAMTDSNQEDEEEPKETRQARKITTRRSSKQSQQPQESASNAKKPMTREDRKIIAIVKAIERLEKKEQRLKGGAKKQEKRRDSDQQQQPQKEQQKEEGQKSKPRKRKGRAQRTSSANSRRIRLDSAESLHSSDDTLLSPPIEAASVSSSSNAAGTLLALANGENTQAAKSPDRMQDSSNSAHSSPETPMSAACLMVAAAVEPLEPGFKFPKTKKVLMNEWLNKSDGVQPASAISPSSLTPHIDSPIFPNTSPTKCLRALAQAATFCEDRSRSGSAKKRWLRQAISEDQCDSPPQADSVAPPKKRRLPRESLSCESSPPTTPTALAPPECAEQREAEKEQEQDVPDDEPMISEEPMIAHTTESEVTLLCDALAAEQPDEEEEEEEDSSMDGLVRECTPPPPVLEETIETRVISMVCAPIVPATPPPQPQIATPSPPPPPMPTRAILDPRLAPRINTSDLVGTVEKTLCYLGYEEKKQSPITPAKRKLSITEYRQRKKLNNNDKSLSSTDDVASMTEESNSQSPKTMRPPSHSSSSVTTPTSSDDEQVQAPQAITPVVEVKALSAFNSEPTELERQRESATLRLKRALGLSVESQAKNISALNVETILKSELTLATPTKTSLSSPNYPIPGSGESTMRCVTSAEQTVDEESQKCSEGALRGDIDENSQDCDEKVKEMPTYPMEERKVLYYTPDDEEVIDSTTYVPPFNNPLYPNSSYGSFACEMDDDARYAARNPSPPPNAASKSS